MPNILTLSRLGLAILMMALLTVSAGLPYACSLALTVFVIAGITDYLDGHLARTRYGVTSFGRLMDPLTDKVLVCAAFVSFVELKLAPAWIVVIIISREFLVTGLRLLAASRGDIIPAGRWGKHKTVWQVLAIVAVLLGLAIRHDVLRNANAQMLESYDYCFGWIAFGITAAVAMITLASGTMYFMEHRNLISGR